MVQVEDIETAYPLHWLVWQNDYKQLEIKLKSKEVLYLIIGMRKVWRIERGNLKSLCF